MISVVGDPAGRKRVEHVVGAVVVVDQCDLVALGAREDASRHARTEIQVAHRALDPFPGIRADIGMTVEHPADGLDRNTGARGDIVLNVDGFGANGLSNDYSLGTAGFGFHALDFGFQLKAGGFEGFFVGVGEAAYGSVGIALALFPSHPELLKAIADRVADKVRESPHTADTNVDWGDKVLALRIDVAAGGLGAARERAGAEHQGRHLFEGGGGRGAGGRQHCPTRRRAPRR